MTAFPCQWLIRMLTGADPSESLKRSYTHLSPSIPELPAQPLTSLGSQLLGLNCHCHWPGGDDITPALAPEFNQICNCQKFVQ